MKVLFFGSDEHRPSKHLMYLLEEKQDPGLKIKIRKKILEIAEEHGLDEIKDETDLHKVIEIIKSIRILN